MREGIREMLRKAGATVIGFASVADGLSEDIRHLSFAISIGVNGNLRESNLDHLKKLQKKTALFLRGKGYRFFCIPPDSDRINDSFASKLYPLFTHKIAATCAGIGWIGRNGLLISPTYGPRLSLATVLTDARFKTDLPIENCLCGDCMLCVDHCPSKAITGETWSRNAPYPDMIKADKCRSHKEKSRPVNGKPNCGLCINICPYGRGYIEIKSEVMEETQ
ncbi:epoxyqueuosine reductase [bacterium BMS3Abin07]|nr:epoxyqueuosine reductase [bacterium BMS3Abin07]GBE31590.1 epoxyqueuosine reductase [bacterium BMS3Bbin05]HDL20974.1 epoxyqueuosine reductase [Nitrospirota bacterium]HDZ88155.1 epoxyqueuosine reductase [Nitrospirota bacterium]